MDLCWSPTQPQLATCSVDNTIIVWNTGRWNEQLQLIKGHTGLVKGVAFDPIGKYLSSQSDDKSLKVWRTSDWKLETSITDPFVECGATTYVLRLSWSPDGQQLVSAHAMNNCGSTAQIIERDGFIANKDFVGHRKAVTCVRFNRHLLLDTKVATSANEKKKKQPRPHCCLAIGSRDRAVSVWCTNLRRPLLVMHDLFTSSVLDLSWSPCGKRLMACSWDGSVSFMEFSEEEIGKKLSDDRTCEYMEKLYGKNIGKNDGNNDTGMFIEDPEILKAREEQVWQLLLYLIFITNFLTIFFLEEAEKWSKSNSERFSVA